MDLIPFPMNGWSPLYRQAIRVATGSLGCRLQISGAAGSFLHTEVRARSYLCVSIISFRKLTFYFPVKTGLDLLISEIFAGHAYTYAITPS
jgi:hypothetical protein